MTRPLRLFARSRRLPTAAFLLAAATTLTALLGGSQVRVGQHTAHMVPSALLLLPALAGAGIAACAHSPMREWDRLGAGRVVRARCAQAAALTAVPFGGALLALPAEILDGRGDLAVARNAMALAGIGLLAATLFGAAAGWLPPLLIAGLALTLGEGPAVAGLWSWLLKTDADASAWGVAVACWLSGAVLHAVRGDRGHLLSG